MTDPKSDGCGCAPPGAGMAAPAAPLIGRTASDDLKAAVSALLVPLRGGFFEMGARQSRYPADLDAPQRKVQLSTFRIGRTVVTNSLYARFAAETGYRSLAEREGWSYVFHLLLPDPARYPNSPPRTPWWRQVHGATWDQPEGPDSSVTGREDHPALHLCWFDAMAFCDFTGTRLPTEAEWEFAARGGLARKQFPWGNALEPGGAHRHNVWQGRFPDENSAEDGFVGTAPADAFPPNGYGLFNMTGNVWEWCADWFGPPPPSPPAPLPIRNPKGPASGPGRVTRGGSYLCHASYCERYKVHSRTQNTPDTSTGNLGFRIAADGEASGRGR